MSERHDLGGRREAVFDALFSERATDLHPHDRAEADAFWTWLGDQPRPAVAAQPPRPLARVRWAVAAALALAVGASTQLWPIGGGAETVTRYAAGSSALPMDRR